MPLNDMPSQSLQIRDPWMPGTPFLGASVPS
jgi:hypothetical protein